MKSSCTIESSVCVALEQDAKSKNQSQLGKRQTAALREVEHPAWWRGLGRSEAKKLICMKRKGGRKKKSGTMKKGKNQANREQQHLKHRQEATCKTRSQPATPMGGGRSSSPGIRALGPRHHRPLRVRVHFKKTHEPNLKTNFVLTPLFRIFNHIRCYKFSP